MKAIRHPLQRLSRLKRLTVLAVSAILTFVLLTVIRTLDAPLRTTNARWGMLSFELARTPERSATIVKSWDSNAEKSAQSSLLLSFLFPACYSTMLTVACLWASGLFHQRGFRKTGWVTTTVAWLQWPAGGFDLVETVSLWVQLNGTTEAPWPRIAFICALVKFTLILAAVGLLVGAAAVWLFRRRAAAAPVAA